MQSMFFILLALVLACCVYAAAPAPGDASAASAATRPETARAHLARRASGNPVIAPTINAACYDSTLPTVAIALYWSWNSLATVGNLDLIIKSPDGSVLSHKAGVDLNELDPTQYPGADPNIEGPYTGYARDVPPCTSPVSPFYSMSGVTPLPSNSVRMSPDEDGSATSSPYAVEFVYLYNVVLGQTYNISVYQSTNTDGFTKAASAFVKMWYFTGSTTTTSVTYSAPSNSACKGRFWNVFSVSFSKPGSYLTRSLSAINTVTSYPFMFGTTATQIFETASRTTTGC